MKVTCSLGMLCEDFILALFVPPHKFKDHRWPKAPLPLTGGASRAIRAAAVTASAGHFPAMGIFRVVEALSHTGSAVTPRWALEPWPGEGASPGRLS